MLVWERGFVLMLLSSLLLIGAVMGVQEGIEAAIGFCVICGSHLQCHSLLRCLFGDVKTFLRVESLCGVNMGVVQIRSARGLCLLPGRLRRSYVYGLVRELHHPSPQQIQQGLPLPGPEPRLPPVLSLLEVH